MYEDLSPSISRRTFAGAVGGAFSSAGTIESFLSSPGVRWTIEISDDSFAAPLAMDESSIYVSTKTGLFALSPTDGNRKWRFDAKYPFFRPSDVRENTLYVDSASSVSAVDVSDGTDRWTFTGGDSLAVAGKTVYSVDANANTLSALSVTTGTERWRFESDIGLFPGVALDDEAVYVGTNQGEILAVSREDGNERWRFASLSIGASSSSPRTLPIEVVSKSPDAGTLYVWQIYETESRLSALSTTDGTERWQFKTTQSKNRFPGVISDNTVITIDGDYIYGLSSADGKTRWKFDAGDTVTGPSRLADGVFYSATTSGSVHAVSVADGTKQWTANVGSSPEIGTIAGTSIAVGNDRGIDVLSTADGHGRWRFASNGDLSWPPRLLGEKTVCFGTKTGTVGVVEAQNGLLGRDLVHETIAVLGGLVCCGLAVGAYRYLRASENEKPCRAKRATFDDFELLQRTETGEYVESYDARLCTEDAKNDIVTLTRFREDVSGSFDEEFERTVKRWTELDYDGFVPILHWGCDPVPWVVSGNAEKELLDDSIDDIRLEEGVEAITTASEALHYAHRNGVVHAHLTPKHIFLTNGSPESASVEFSPLRFVASAWDPYYVAPEQAEPGDNTCDRQTDVYRLGAITYRLVTGSPPASIDSRLESVKQSVSMNGLDADTAERIEEVLAMAMAQDVEERYETALEFRDALRWAVFIDER